MSVCKVHNRRQKFHPFLILNMIVWISLPLLFFRGQMTFRHLHSALSKIKWLEFCSSNGICWNRGSVSCFCSFHWCVALQRCQFHTEHHKSKHVGASFTLFVQSTASTITDEASAETVCSIVWSLESPLFD
jgi:hypothetical protein